MPAATRTRTGTIQRADYSYSSLKLQGESANATVLEDPRPKRPRKPSVSQRGGRRNPKGIVIKGTNPPITVYDPKPLLPEDFDLEKFRKEFLPHQPRMPDVCDGNYFVPPVGFGERLEKGMSKVERLEDKLRKWEIVRESHVEHHPSAVPMIDLRMKELRDEIAATPRTEENTRVIDEQKRKQEIQERIETLQKGLVGSKFEPERENIRAAIAGYHSGDIGFVEHYTLIWKGKIVDRADTYAAFTADRQERLDRYEKEHGPHWLWWERGLNIHPDLAPHLAPAMALNRDVSPTGLGQYYIWQAVWKRSRWVSRMPSLAGVAAPAAMSEKFLASPEGLVYCQEEGPKLCYPSLLDSGATYATLYRSDFYDLGVDENNYAAQSIESFVTAGGLITARTYEMFVCVLSNDQFDLVDSSDPTWPPPVPSYLGGLCPVSEVVGDPPVPDSEGRVVNRRLSGLVPFLACYLQSTPTNNTIWFGEDRNDVVGLHRMPGQRRWDISYTSEAPNFAGCEPSFSNPKILFTHRKGTVVDQDRDQETHNSDLYINAGTIYEIRLVGHPGRQPSQQLNAESNPGKAMLPQN